MKQITIYIIILIHLLLFLNAIEGSAQTNTKSYDSLVRIYKSLPDDTSKSRILNQLYKATSYSDIDLATSYVQEQIKLSKKINDLKGEGSAYLNLSHYYQTKLSHDSAVYYLQKALPIFEASKSYKDLTSLNRRLAITEHRKGNLEQAMAYVNNNTPIYKVYSDSNSLARDYNIKSAIYKDLGQREKAFEVAIAAYDIYKAIDEDLGRADVLYALSLLEGEDGYPEKAINYLLEALPLYETHNDLLYQSIVATTLGHYYHRIDDLQNAERYAKKAVQLAETLNNPVSFAQAYELLGQIYAKQEKFNASLISYQKGLSYVDELISPSHYSKLKYNLSQLYIKMGKPQLAIGNLDELIDVNRRTNLIKSESNALEARSRAYSALNNYERALEDYINFKTLNDSLYSEEKTKEVEKLRASFDTERKEQQIKQQEAEISLFEKEQEVSRLQKLGLVFGLIALAIILGLVFFSFREKRKRAAAERQKLQVELISRQKELTTYALHMAKKNEVLEGLRSQAETFKALHEDKKGYQDIIRTINFDLQDDNNWEDFSKYFEQVHGGFNERIKFKYPDVSIKDLRLMALLRMNLSSKEIANVLNISPDGVKKARYRLRKKLDISTESSLNDFVMAV